MATHFRCQTVSTSLEKTCEFPKDLWNLTYVQDFRGTGIHYLKEIVDGTCEHAVNVWVCGETVLYLSPPVMNRSVSGKNKV